MCICVPEASSAKASWWPLEARNPVRGPFHRHEREEGGGSSSYGAAEKEQVVREAIPPNSLNGQGDKKGRVSSIPFHLHLILPRPPGLILRAPPLPKCV